MGEVARGEKKIMGKIIRKNIGKRILLNKMNRPLWVKLQAKITTTINKITITIITIKITVPSKIPTPITKLTNTLPKFNSAETNFNKK